jgi:hypothetical protein
MQAEKATADGELVDPSAFDEPLEPVGDGLRVHADASRTRTAATTIAAEVRDVASLGGITCRPRCREV